MKINTVLFDLDGTLVNTNELIIASFEHTLNKYYPNKYTKEDILPFMGPTLEESFGTVDKDRVDELIATYRKFNRENHDAYVREFDTVYETVGSLKEQGYKMAIVTSKIRYMANMGMKLARLNDFFDVVVAVDDVTHAKPHPEPVEKALSLLGAKPEEAVMVGDNHHDIEGGRNAGVKTAAVAWSAKGRDFLASYAPDYMLEQMSDLLKIVGE